jgi:hypothetical protein
MTCALVNNSWQIKETPIVVKDEYTDKYFAEKNSRNTTIFRPPRPPKPPKDEINRYCISMARKQAALSTGFSVHRVTKSSVG